MRITLRGGARQIVYLGVHDSLESKAEYARRIQPLTSTSATAALAKLDTARAASLPSRNC